MVLLLLTVYVDAFSCVRYRWLKLRDASADLAIILCQCTLKIPRVEVYARIEPSVVYSTVMFVQSRPTLCTQGVLCILEL